jgi:hypothetical protein
MTIQQAIASGKRHKRPYMHKWMPKCERVEQRGSAPVDENGFQPMVLLITHDWKQVPSELLMFSVAGYCANDVMFDDWEIEE